MSQPAHPPETAEGWYALHQVFAADRRALRGLDAARRSAIAESAVAHLCALVRRPDGEAAGRGWSAFVSLIGSPGEVMLMHFRETLDALGETQAAIAREPLFDYLTPTYSFLSVTEAGFYHITADAGTEAAARGGQVGDAAYTSRIADRVRAELASPHVRGRLYPPLPAEMPYVSFYPMSKRRDAEQNWYALTLAERSRLMIAHGHTGRRYAGRVVQVITGAIGLSAWEWGVTLFARDPLDFKRIVTDMRFDEASAKYAEFGDFYVGRLRSPEEWVTGLVDGSDES
jgi:chlorite dismutase